MSLKMNINGFGTKGIHERPVTFAESLLTGRPVSREPQRVSPKLKARARPRFGRKSMAETFSVKVNRSMKRRTIRFWAGLILGLTLAAQALTGMFDLPSPTLGGRQLWTDVRVQGGWRVQCHAWTGHCRLLDTNDIRRTWGGEAEMLTALDRRIAIGDVRAPSAHAVVLVHGLGRSAHSLDALATDLRTEGYEVVTFRYASTRGTIAQHGAALNRVLNGLKGSTRVSFVTHSLGAIVLRQALNTSAPWRVRMALGRAVLLAPPNQGSQAARTLSGNILADRVFGPALTELADPDLGSRLPLSTPFAIVAGTNDSMPFVDGVNDSVVSVEETKLNGSAKHLTVAASHTFIMDDKDAIAFAKDFLAVHN